MQYAHDSMGNRTGRSLHQLRGEEGEFLVAYADTALQRDWWLPEAEDEDVVGQYVLTDPDKDVPHGRLVKSWIQKQAYYEEMLRETAALEPIPSSRGPRDVSSYDVGEIPLAYGLSPTGARTYSVPIQTAPDIKYAPSLSLVYNSQGGHGYGGYGWDIGGVSEIRLASRSLYYDGVIRAASALDTAAVFSLDGVRLVMNDDSATSATYPLTTARGHILVAPHKNSHGYVSWFQALYPDGTIARYGTGEDVAFQMPSYPIVRSTNIDGEKIEYTYSVETTDGNHALTRVRYGFNSSGTAYGEIVFSSASQTAYGYYAGKKVKRAPRLTSIVSRNVSTNLYTYGLTYESVFGASLLKSISLTNYAGHQFPPLNFTYGHTASPHTGNDSLKVIHSYSFSDSLSTSGRNDAVLRRGKFLSGNYNDGVIAYISKPIYGQVSNNVYQCCYPTNLFAEYVAALVDNAPVGFWFISDSGFQTLEAVDTDGDGVDEVVEVYSGTTTSTGTNLIIKIWRSDEDGEFQLSDTHTVFMPGSIQGGGTYSPYNRTYRWGDFLGTGKTQLLVINYRNNGFDRAQEPNFTLIDLENGTKLYEDGLIEITLANEGRLLCMDIDGDSRTDVCWTDNTGLHKYGFDGADFILEKTYSNITPSIITADNVSFTDINADGYIDIVKPTPPGGQWTMWLNTGESFEAKVITLTSATGYGFFFMDINRDGYPDIIRLSSSSMGYYLNIDGTSFGSYQSSYASINTAKGVLPPNVVDYTSMCALVKLNGSTVCEYGFTTFAPEARQLVQSEDSYGKILRDTYGYLPHSAQYWTENPTWTDTTGYQLRTLPIYVLKGAKGLMSGDSGAATFLQESYTWSDGVVNVRGLGFCGFSRSSASDIRAYPYHVTVSRFNPRRTGIPESTTVYLGNIHGPYYSRATYTFDDHSTAYGKLSPRLTGSTETSTLTNITRTTSVTYDSYDFPTKTVESSRIGSGTPLYRTTSITYTHSNDTTSYVLGAVNTSTVSTERDGIATTKWIKRTSLTYDSSFHPLTRVQSVSQDSVSFNVVSKEQWTYDAKGNVLTEKSAPYNSQEYVGSTYTYDTSGRHLVTSTDALGHTTTYSSFNQYGSPTTATDYRNRVTSLVYDSWGGRTGATYPDGTAEAATTAWGGEGLFTITKTVSGSPDTFIDYDALGREVRSAEKTFDGQWRMVATAYDAKGRVSYVTYPYRGTTWTKKKAKYTYDSYGRPTKVADDSGAQTKWSYSGTSVTETKDSISITRTTNAFGDLVGAADAGGTTTYTLRDDGSPSSVSVTCSNVSTVTTFSYDAYGRRTSITDPSAGTRTTSYTWNTDGTSSTTQTNDKGSITTSLDKYGRVTAITRPNSFNTAYTYDTYGRLVSEVSTNSTSEEYTYDSYDRPSTVKQYVPDGKWLQKSFTYGAGSIVSSIAYTSQDGYITTETYSYANGHNTSITLPGGTEIISVTAENDLGQPTSATSAGITRTYEYTQYGFPTSRKLAGGTLQDLRTTFDPTTGNLLSRRHVSPGLPDEYESFTYDALGRLKSTDWGAVTYATNGNVLSKGGVGTLTYSSTGSPYKIDRLYATYSSVTRVNTQTITYSEYDRPATITEGPPVATFTYDSNYDRVKMLISVYGSTVAMKYYIGGRYEYEATASGNAVQRLFLGGDAYNAPMVLQKTGSGAWTPYVIGRDYLGSITHIVDTSGSLVAEYSYDAWGRMRDPLTFTPYSISSEPSLLLGRGYCGHEHLPIFGLINMNARLYDPVTGRFLSPDPYVQVPYFSQNFNRYSYALNNPLKYTDESGEAFGWDDVIAGAIGGTINVISNWSVISQHGFWTGVAYFGIGFAGGIASIYLGAATGSGLMAAANTIVSSGFGEDGQWRAGNVDIKAVAFNGMVGAMTTWVGGKISSFLSSSLGDLTSQLIPGKAWAGMINQGVSSGATGFVMSGSVSMMNQYKENDSVDWTEVWTAAGRGGLTGLALGAIAGTAQGVKDAHKAGENPWALTEDQLPPREFTSNYHSLGAKNVSKQFKLLNEKYLQRLGLNPHEFKESYMGKGNNSIYNIYEGPNGQLFICRPSAGVEQPTSYYIKDNQLYYIPKY